MSALVIIAYVAIGGYTAVVWTGFVQGIVMILGVVLLTVVALNRAGGLEQVFARLGEIEPGRFLATPGIWGWPGLLSFTMIVSFGVWGMPQLVTRFYSIRNVSVLRLGTVLATAGGCMALLPYFNGALARVLFPNLAKPDLAIPMLVKETMSPFTSALFLAGVIAAGMSTFASILIVAVSSLVKDLARDGLGAKLSPKREALASRLVSIGIGLAAVLVALRPPAMILVITGFAWAVIASTTLWPYLFGLYWRRPSGIAVAASMVSGCAVALVWMALKNPLGLHGFVAGMAANLVVLVLVSLFTRPPVAAARAAFGESSLPAGSPLDNKGG